MVVDMPDVLAQNLLAVPGINKFPNSVRIFHVIIEPGTSRTQLRIFTAWDNVFPKTRGW